MMLWIEIVTVLIITAAFVVTSFFIFKPEHVEHHPLRVRVGAGLQGFIVGLLIGFVIVPLRMTYMGATGYGAPPSPGLSSLALLPAVILLLLIRRGALLRAPVISPFLRAYRRAMLLRARDETAKQLSKLDEIEGRKAAV